MKDGPDDPHAGMQTDDMNRARTWWRARHRILMEALFLAVVVMTVIGIALTNITPSTSYRYWLMTVGLFAIAGILTGNIRAWEEHRSLLHVTAEQTTHWAVTLLAVLIVHLMLLSGRLTFVRPRALSSCSCSDRPWRWTASTAPAGASPCSA